MTVLDQLRQSLDRLGAFSSGEQVVQIDHGPQHMECRLSALDSLACAFTRLSVHAASLTERSSDQLRKTAEQLSGRLTYLLEPISPIETDSEGCVVQMRSNPPHKESDCTSYYELLVSRSGELSLCRYARSVGQQREVIPAHVTREVLGRLAADFSAAAT
jgi:hypothetical protein